MMWATLEQARQDWADAQHLTDAVLTRLLVDATDACAAFAPMVPAGVDPPAPYARAVVLQARELWAAAHRDGDLIGGAEDAYAVRVRPLTGSVRQILRPRAGVPRLG